MGSISGKFKVIGQKLHPLLLFSGQKNPTFLFLYHLMHFQNEREQAGNSSYRKKIKAGTRPAVSPDNAQYSMS